MSHLSPSEILLSEEQIQKRITAMAVEIRRGFPDDLHMVAVLKGAFVFLLKSLQSWFSSTMTNTV